MLSPDSKSRQMKQFCLLPYGGRNRRASLEAFGHRLGSGIGLRSGKLGPVAREWEGCLVTVGVIGLGTMGGAIGLRLIASGHSVSGYDINPGAMEQFRQAGAQAVGLEEVTKCEVLITSLPTDEDALEVLVEAGMLQRLGRDATLIEMSTLLPRTITRIAGEAAQYQIQVVDCPISGGPPEASRGGLSLLVGAEPATLEQMEPVLTSLGTIHHVGAVGQGKTVKLVNNVMTMGNMIVAAEAFVLGVKAGLAPQALFEVLNQSGGRSFHFSKRLPNVLQGCFEPGFALYLGEKDLRVALQFAHETGYPMPVTAAVHQFYELAKNLDLGQEDIAAIFKVYESWAGIEARAGRE